MVIGAAWNGARAFTATSGPGISLMQEFLGLAYFAEIPAVLFDVQRGSPSTGMPTRTQQADIVLCAYASHGDTKHVLLFPEDPREAFAMGAQAFDLADRLQTPIFVLSDLDLGMNLWMTEPLPYPERAYDRGKILDVDALDDIETWGRYRDVDGDGIPFRTLPGTPDARAGYVTRGSGHDEDALYSELPEVYQHGIDRLARKHDTARALVPQPIVDEADRSVGLVAYGTTHHAVVEAREQLTAAGIDLDYLRIRALPLSAQVAQFIERHERVYVVEQNRDGQMHTLLRAELPGRMADRLVSIRHYNGVPIDAGAITEPLLAAERVVSVETVKHATHA
jgi:2-oxoglutarate ferredoxin oxidoreductase subunit alpha